MKLLFFLFMVVCVSCLPSKSFYQSETEKISSCRENWKTDSLAQNTTIKLLMHDPRGNGHLSGWPNFFIGITEQGDTIGIIAYNTDAKFNKNTTLSFKASRIRNSEMDISSQPSNMPGFFVHKSKVENDLYCSVKIIYYGELLE